MSLSMEERRILAEIEIQLSANDPRLAHRLSRLGQERPRRRIRLIAAIVVAAIGVVTAIATAIITAIS
ncbi:DUF3040 domain-containing protein [Spirillospora sp. NPDC048911]|uniref:DUF3040 domain-containing protein n=1 Tax=Spirillospora sp. NPDC048911 TaxID=3364527 RepID=UPI00371CFD11